MGRYMGGSCLWVFKGQVSVFGSVLANMAALEENSRSLLNFVKGVVSKLIEVMTPLIALAELGAPFAQMVFSVVKLKLMEMWLDLDQLDPHRGGGGDGGRGEDGPGDRRPPGSGEDGRGDGPGDGGVGGVRRVPHGARGINGSMMNGHEPVRGAASVSTSSVPEVEYLISEVRARSADTLAPEKFSESRLPLITWPGLEKKSSLVQQLEDKMTLLQL